jgi:hypothetical protein
MQKRHDTHRHPYLPNDRDNSILHLQLPLRPEPRVREKARRWSVTSPLWAAMHRYTPHLHCITYPPTLSDSPIPENYNELVTSGTETMLHPIRCGVPGHCFLSLSLGETRKLSKFQEECRSQLISELAHAVIYRKPT